jgi:Trk K+ transport system NAD-binding subunit
VVIAMDDDLANLEVALDSRRLHPDIRVVMRMFDQNMADKIREGFDIHQAMSQSAQSAPAFATAAIDSSILSSFSVDDELVVMRQWSVREGGPLAGKTVGQIMTELGCGVTRLQPDGAAAQLFPAPDTRVNPGDELLVQGPFSTIAELKANGNQ